MNESFIKIPTFLLEVNIPKNAIVLLGILQSNSKRLGYAYGSNKYYADKLNCSTRTISKLIKCLLEHNYITISNPKSFKRKIYVSSNILGN